MILFDESNPTSLTPEAKAHLLAVDAKARAKMHQRAAAVEFYHEWEILSGPEPERLGVVIERWFSINADLVWPREASSIS